MRKIKDIENILDRQALINKLKRKSQENLERPQNRMLPLDNPGTNSVIGNRLIVVRFTLVKYNGVTCLNKSATPDVNIE